MQVMNKDGMILKYLFFVFSDVLSLKMLLFKQESVIQSTTYWKAGIDISRNWIDNIARKVSWSKESASVTY